MVNSNVAKVEDASDPRRQGQSRSELLRTLDNKGDGVLSVFPKGKQHGVNAIIIGNNREFSLDQDLWIGEKPLFKLFYKNLTVLFMQL